MISSLSSSVEVWTKTATRMSDSRPIACQRSSSPTTRSKRSRKPGSRKTAIASSNLMPACAGWPDSSPRPTRSGLPRSDFIAVPQVVVSRRTRRRRMRCLTDERCKEWMQGRELALPEEHSNYVAERVWLKEWHSFPVAQWLADQLTCRDETLLWITEWKVWPSSENWYLYYTLRRLAGDRGFLHEAPGHLFQAFELEELTTILQVSILNGWGGYFMAAGGNINAFFSHDGYIDFYASNAEELDVIRKRFSAD